MSIKYLQMHPHPGCCGVYNITNFGSATTVITPTDKTPLSAVKQELKYIENIIPDRILLATLNDEQVPFIEPILKELGWSLLIKDAPGLMKKGEGLDGMFLNDSPEDSHTNNLYCKVLRKVKSTEVAGLSYHK